MRSNLFLAVGLGLALAPAARADMAAPDPLMVRLINAQGVIIGKVTEYEKKPVSTTRTPKDKQKTNFQVMVVKIDDHLRGFKGETHVRVGFIPVNSLRRGNTFAAPAVGSRACFFLAPHHKESFFVAQPYWDIVPEGKGTNFEATMKSLKEFAAVYDQPEKALTSKKPEERFNAAAVLILKYRGAGGVRGNGKPLGTKQEPIDARQSKLILEALRDSDWTKPYSYLQVSPQYVFYRLGLTKADGWNPKRFVNQKDQIAQTKKWLTDHAGTYRIKKFVP